MQWLFFGNETISLTSQFDNDKSKEPNSTSGHDQKEETVASCLGSKGLDLFSPLRFQRFLQLIIQQQYAISVLKTKATAVACSMANSMT